MVLGSSPFGFAPTSHSQAGSYLVSEHFGVKPEGGTTHPYEPVLYLTKCFYSNGWLFGIPVLPPKLLVVVQHP